MSQSSSRLQVRGATVDAAKRYAMRHRGSAEYTAFVDSLEPSERELLEGRVNRSGWYSVPVYSAMITKASEHLAPQTPETFLSEGGAFVLDDGVNSLYRAFFAIARPSFVLRGSALLWSRFFKGSRLTVASSGRRFAKVHIVGADFCSKPLCISIVGGMVRSLEHGGAHTVQVDHHRCRSEGGAHCEVHTSWR